MRINKVEFDGQTLMDLTDSTVTPDSLAEGAVAYDASGERIVGTVDFNGIKLTADTALTKAEQALQNTANADTVDGKHAEDLQNYNNLSNKPSLATVATSGNYNDLSNKPTIPTSLPASGGNSDTLDNLHSTAFQQQFHFSTETTASGWYKIKIKSTRSWMLSCLVILYQAYNPSVIMISGYNYLAQNSWYTPRALLLDSSKDSMEVRFGYDDPHNLWFAVPADYYTGLTITNINNGYEQIDNWANQFSLEQQSTISGNTTNTFTIYRPWKKNETVSNADSVGGYSANLLVKSVNTGRSTVDNTGGPTLIYNVEGEDVGIGNGLYYHIINLSGYSGGHYNSQIAMPYQNNIADSAIYIRTAVSTSWRAWRRLVDENLLSTWFHQAHYGSFFVGESFVGLGSYAAGFGSGEALGQKSFAANSGKANEYGSFAANSGTASANNSFAANSGTATGIYSSAFGSSSTASAYASSAFGESCEVVSPYGFAAGYYTKASGAGYGTAFGCKSGAYAYASMATGYFNDADNFGSLTTGKYGKFLTSGASYNTNVGDAFGVGNGTSTGARSLAFRVSYAGSAYAKASINSTGADYAEFIKPWEDGNPDDEDRCGYFVTVNENYIRIAEPGDYIAGVISGNPSVIGNADEDYYWMYERDVFNRVVWEDVPETVQKTKTITEERPKFDENNKPVLDEEGNRVMETITREEPEFDEETNEPIMIETGKTIPKGRQKLNPNYDSSLQETYVERKDRKEWDYVGMLGVIPTRDDGTCIPGRFAKCGPGGIATLAEERGFETYYVIERITPNIVSLILR